MAERPSSISELSCVPVIMDLANVSVRETVMPQRDRGMSSGSDEGVDEGENAVGADSRNVERRRGLSCRYRR